MVEPMAFRRWTDTLEGELLCLAQCEAVDSTAIRYGSEASAPIHDAVVDDVRD
jgi:hypothetical protein